MSDEKIAMPGDADESPAKLSKVRKDAAEKKAAEAEASGKAEDKTPERKAQADAATGKDQPGVGAGERGELFPQQYEGDGWGDTPAQMR